MKRLLILLATLASCSGGNFSEDDKIAIRLNGISFSIEKNPASLSLYPNITLTQGDYEIPLEKENAYEFLQDYFWVISGDTSRNYYAQKNGYGSHPVKFVIVDYFGDTLSDSLQISVDDCVFFEKSCKGGF